jgi:hypothetical protein
MEGKEAEISYIKHKGDCKIQGHQEILPILLNLVKYYRTNLFKIFYLPNF